MAAKKKATQSRQRSARRVGDAALRSSVLGGSQAAEKVLAFREQRARQRKQKASVSLKQQRALRVQTGSSTPEIPARTRSLLGPASSSGILIAEGDSWFDYPMQDVVRLLEDNYFFDVESVAHRGDRIEDMAYSQGQFEEFARRLEKLLREGKVPRAILLSGGGNDIAGDEFAQLLNHATSPLPHLNEDIVRGVIDVRLRDAYARIISGLTTIATSYLDAPIPIVTHGYAYPTPDGRGFMGGWAFLPGPWLRPGFHQKGYADLQQNTTLIGELIDRFNTMLASVTSFPQFQHVRYVDLRDTLHSGTGHKKHWANELHPNKLGFEIVTRKIVEAVWQL